MKIHALFIAISILLLPVITSIAKADELRIPVGQQAQDKSDIARPNHGDTIAEVQDQFGEPLEWSDAVGEPPISSWIYSDFIVYFEHDIVLHVVLKGTAKLAD